GPGRHRSRRRGGDGERPAGAGLLLDPLPHRRAHGQPPRAPGQPREGRRWRTTGGRQPGRPGLRVLRGAREAAARDRARDGGEAVVEKGLSAGERVVTDGQLRLVPGVKVEPKEAAPTPATTS